VTKDGVSNFITHLAEYDTYGSLYDATDDDAEADNADGAVATCEKINGNYVGLGCGEDGSFVLEYYSDAYCLTPTGKVYDKLKTLNNQLKSYRSCSQIPVAQGGEDGSLIQNLVYYSDSCSSLDSGLCSDTSSMRTRRSYSSGTNSYLSHNRFSSSATRTWLTKLKYVAGGVLLLASFVMFTGILFTNRRRRRALMQRKYRQSRGSSARDAGSRRSKSRSKSKSRDASRKSRSKSKSRISESAKAEGDGVFT
jgi:hypothetical protein